MKLLLVTPYYYPKFGGLETYTRQLALALRDGEGTEIVVVTTNHDSRGTIVEHIDGMKIYRLHYWFKFSNTPVNPSWSSQMRRIIATERPDIIHAHTPVPTMAEAAARAAGRTPFVLTYHAATLLKSGSPLFNLVARAYGLYERRMLARANKIFAVSSYVRDELPASVQAKTVVMPNAVWESDITTRHQPNEASFIFIGSLDESHSWKGLEPTLRALAHYKAHYEGEPTLIVLGDGNARARYERLTTKLGLGSNVSFLGFKNAAERDVLLSQATALIAYPTSANDAFPTVFLEAWAKALPLVTAAIGPIPSLVEDAVTGYVVRPNDPEALSETLHKVVNDSSGRQRVAKQAAKMVRANYTWERQAAATVRELGGLA